MSKESIITAILWGDNARAPLTKNERKNAQLAALLQRESEGYLGTHKDVIRQGLKSLFDKAKAKKIFGYYKVSTKVAKFIIHAQHEDVNMSGEDITEKEVVAIAELLKTNNFIKTLNLIHTGITDKGAEVLANALSTNDSLHTLHLDKNAIGNTGVRAIGAWLQHNRSITRISLRKNNINDEGLDGLLADVSTNSFLFQMDVLRNPVSAEKEKYSREQIKDNFRKGRDKLVVEIADYLKGPDISALRTQQFIKTLTNHPLHYIELKNGTLTVNGADAMKKIIQGSREIVELSCYNMHMEEGVVETIKDMLESPAYPIKAVRFADCNTTDKDSQDFLAIARTHVEARDIVVERGDVSQETRRRAFEIASAVRDVVTDYTYTIVVPQLVKIVNGDPAVTAKDREGFVLDSHSMSVLNRLTAEYLFKGLSDQQIEAFSEHWHQPLQQGKSQKLKDYGGVSWPPLLGEKEIAIPSKITGETGWKLVSLTTPAELEAEGEALEHCVGGYTVHCANENSHIISVRGPDGTPRSTMEIKTDYRKGSYNIVQNYGRKNTPPATGSPAAKVPKWLKPRLDNIDYAALSGARAERVSSAVTFEHKTTQIIGFDPLDPQKTKKANKLYGGDMLPSKAKNEALRKQLETNFRPLHALQVIDLGSVQIGGKSVFSLPKPEVQLPMKKAKANDVSHKEQGDIRHAIQRPVNILFGKDNVGVVVSKTEGGGYAIGLKCNARCPIGIEGVANRMREVLAAQVETNTDNGLNIIGLEPLSIMARLETAVAIPGRHIERHMARSNVVEIAR